MKGNMLILDIGQRDEQANRTVSGQVEELAKGIKKSQSIHV